MYFSIIIHHLALKERCRPHRLSNMHFTACKWCADGHLGGVYASQVRHSQATRRYSISYTLHTPPRVTYLFHVPHSHVLHRLYHPARTLFRTNLKVALTGKPNQHHQQPHHRHRLQHAYRTRRAVRSPPNLHLRRLHPRPQQKPSPLARPPGPRRRHYRPLLM
jgi:hypothetical protein